ncbi:hypothetical protein GALL_134240 [mine drainage metagenome]|uniref:4'-phosphopantetheinyl transferase domain-containing protein n=1 Tax=mine drainage metagenome TaxID=410659 RepID=A0A1J5S8N3_9ZZZZ
MVYAWPASASQVKLEQGLLILKVQTLPSMPRTEIRQQARKALKEALAMLLDYPVTEIEFESQPGQAIQLLHPKLNIGLSISHDHGMSLVAINMNGKIGVDLMTLNSSPAINEIHTLATDYLGDKTAEYIAQLPSALQQEAFAKEWTALEARIKCNGEALAEWNIVKINLANINSRALEMPKGYVATVAFSTSPTSSL